MKNLLTLIALLFIGMNSVAQDLDIPQNLELKTEADYKKLEPLVLQSIDWLQNEPMEKNEAKRKEVNAFLVQWMSGTPSVSIGIVADLVPLECADCMVAFMCGWTKYSLENNYSKDNLQCAQRGVERTIAFYKKNKKALGKNKEVENLISLQKKGKLKAFIVSKY